MGEGGTVEAVRRKNRRLTFEAKRRKKLEARPTFGNGRAEWLAKLMRSKYAPNECRAERKR